MKRKPGRKPKPGPRQPNGEPSRISKERQEEAMATVLEARVRHSGRASAVPLIGTRSMYLRSDLEDAKAPWMGCNAGRAIAHEENPGELWAVICEVRRRRAAYLRTQGIASEHAKTAKIEMEPVPFEVRDDDPPADIRTDHEKAHDADRAWQVIVSALCVQDPPLLRYVEQAIILDMPIGGPIKSVLMLIQAAIEKRC